VVRLDESAHPPQRNFEDPLRFVFARDVCRAYVQR
jgi:hypothetical protein